MCSEEPVIEIKFGRSGFRKYYGLQVFINYPSREKAGKLSYKIGKGCPPKHSRFKPGQSGNPEGARKHSHLKKVLKKLTLEELVSILNDTLGSTEADVKGLINNPDSNLAKVIIGKAALRAAKKGDIKLFNTLVEPIIGKQF